MKKCSLYLNKILTNNLIMLSFFTFISIMLCVIFRYEVVSDFINYHYYLPWAYFHNRTFTDIAVAMENSYHNPLIEMPLYFITNAFNDTPIVLHIYNALFWGALVFVFYKLCLLRFDILTICGKIQTAVTMLLVMTGFALLTQNGTSSNEVPVILGVMTSLYFLYKELFVLKKQRADIFFLTGCLMGACLGLKLTCITYCLSLGFTLIIFFKYLREPFKAIGLFIIGGFLGFVLTDGWWACILYQEFDNPMFPYMNTLFKSPYYADKFLTYSSFYEKKPIDYLIFPFLASFQRKVQITSEAYMLDARLALGYILLFIYLITALIKKRLIADIKNHPATTFLVIFTILSYAIWFQIFSIIRYAIPIEMIISLMIVTYVSGFKPQKEITKIIHASVCIILLFILLSGLPFTSWGNRKYMDKIRDVERVTLPKNSLLLGLSPNTGLAVTKIVEDNPDVKIANETSSFTLPDTYMFEKIKEYRKHSNFVGYLIALKTTREEFDRNSPVKEIKDLNIPEIFENLQYIIKYELGVNNFYCRSIHDVYGFNRIFLCIDKKNKRLVFPRRLPSEK